MDAYNPVITAIESNSGGTVIAERLVELRPSMRIELVKTSETSKRINTDRVALAIDQGDLIYPPDWAGLGEMKRFGALSRKA
jgi:phage terminase large subunit-like protein